MAGSIEINFVLSIRNPSIRGYPAHLSAYSECLAELVRDLGVRGFIRFIHDALNGR